MRPKTTDHKPFLARLARLVVLFARLMKQIWVLPSIIVAALKRRRRQAALDAAEAERLDRIRNPSDYLGK